MNTYYGLCIVLFASILTGCGDSNSSSLRESVTVNVESSVKTDLADGNVVHTDSSEQDSSVEDSDDALDNAECDQGCTHGSQYTNAIQLTNKPETIFQLPEVVTSASGDMIVAYSDASNSLLTKFIVSQDDGVTWQHLSGGFSRLDAQSLESTIHGELIGLTSCDFSICLLRGSEQGVDSSQSLEVLLSNLEVERENYSANDEGYLYPYSQFKLYQTRDGGYILGFSLRKTVDEIDSDLYLIKTFDFINAESFIKLNKSDGAYGDLDIAEGPDGSLVIAYKRVQIDEPVSWTVEQGANLEALEVIANEPRIFSDVEIVIVDERVLLIGSLFDSLYELKVMDGGLTLYTTLYSGGVSLGFSAVTLSDGDVGIVYAADFNGQRDIYMDRIEVEDSGN